MKTASTFSRRKICSNVRRTVVVPPPEDPVTEMMGCRTDIDSVPEQAALAEERRTFHQSARVDVIARQLGDLAGRTEDERRPLVQALRGERQDRVDAVGRGPAGPLHQEGD